MNNLPDIPKWLQALSDREIMYVIWQGVRTNNQVVTTHLRLHRRFNWILLAAVLAFAGRLVLEYL